MNHKLLLRAMVVMTLILSAATLWADIPVTFQADMSIKIAEGVFTPGVDTLTLRGGFMKVLGCDGDWFPSEGAYKLADEDQDTIYTLTLNFPDSTDGKTYEYKYQMNDDVWESCDNHTFKVVSPSTVIPVVLFENDSVITKLNVNFVYFTLDLTSFYGSGMGFFDPSTDSIKIEGFWGDGVSEELSDAAARWCKENVWQPGIYETMITVRAEEGKNPEFKAHAFPEDHYSNWGWETTDNKSFTVIGDSQDVYISYVPDIMPQVSPLEADLTVLFTVDVSNAVNRHNTGVAVNPDSITHVGLKGQNEVLGAWGGDWTLADTVSTDSTDATLLMLNDKGLNGDVTAGDNIWSLSVTFAAGITGGPCLYKYSIYYPGADTLVNFDNEMEDTDDNHYLYISPDFPTVMNDIFGVASTNGTPDGVEKEEVSTIAKSILLHQNYPNPFNPTTNICFELPQACLTSVAIYNMLGQQVQTLVNSRMDAGRYTVKFDAAHLSSGVYFVRLQSSGQIQTRKMMLLK